MNFPCIICENGDPYSNVICEKCEESLEEEEEMNLDELKKLNAIYQNALMVCDPLDFANRQKNLLHEVCKHLLKPLFDIEAEKHAKDAEGAR